MAATNYPYETPPRLPEGDAVVLGELVVGQKPGRESPDEKTMTANLGLALDDMAVAPLIFRKATEKGLGTWLPL